MTLLHRMTEAELPLCLCFNRVGRRRQLHYAFAIVSRLGDGVFWYIVMLAIPVLYGVPALQASGHMLAVGIVSLMIYRWLKRHTGRARPYSVNGEILLTVRALDEFSFPSGHTMHAVGFSVVLLSYHPEWSVVILPFTVLVALSRLVLGLHYPSDVLVGAAIGAGVGLLSLQLV